MPDPLAATLGRRIRALRREKNLTLRQLAENTEIPKAHLSTIEHGRAVIDLGTASKLAQGLGVKLLDVMTFPAQDARQQLIDLMRHAFPHEIVALDVQIQRLSEAAERIDKIVTAWTNRQVAGTDN